jgi:hypothetical protein
MAEYSRMAKGHFTSTGGQQAVILPFTPDSVELFNYTASGTPANHGVPFAYWDISMGQGFAIEQVFNGTPVLTTDTVTVNGISTVQAALALQYGAVVQHGGTPVSDFSISKANPAVVTTVGNHGLTTGNWVVFSNLSQTSSTGMQQIAGIPFMITVLSATTFSIPWNTNQSNYTAFNTATSTNNVGSYKLILYPVLYAPNQAVISAITTGTTTTITTTAPSNFVVGQEIAFRIPTAWGTTQLNSLPNLVIPGSPVYGYVISVTNSTTFVCNINSTGFTAFNSNLAFASYPGEKFPQVVPVGDVNTGGIQISSGSALYPSPTVFNGYVSSTTVGANTINGPAIQGAFVNATWQGFIVGNGAGTNDASSVLVGANGNVIYWRAFYHDYAAN